MWVSITDYLNREIHTPEANEAAKREALDEADQRFQGAEQRIDQWRKQLEGKDQPVWRLTGC